jgi:hypothetical protein
MKPGRRSTKDITAIFRDGKAIDEALKQAFHEAVREHRRYGAPMVFWENGKVVKVAADQIPLPEDQLTPVK